MASIRKQSVEDEGMTCPIIPEMLKAEQRIPRSNIDEPFSMRPYWNRDMYAHIDCGATKGTASVYCSPTNALAATCSCLGPRAVCTCSDIPLPMNKAEPNLLSSTKIASTYSCAGPEYDNVMCQPTPDPCIIPNNGLDMCQSS